MRIRHLLSLALLSSFHSVAFAQARDVNAGPIFNQEDAKRKCPRVCPPPEKWNGQWRTTVPGKMSVCGCLVEAPVVVGPPPPRQRPGAFQAVPPPEPPPPPPPPAPAPPPPPPAASHDVNAGPIWNQADASQKCPNVCRPPERWNGQWRTTVPGRMSVCGCDYPTVDLSGVYDGQHPQWSDSITLEGNGRYRRGSGDGGSWSFDGRVLVLRWDHWGPATLVLQPDGAFYDPQQNFRLTRHVVAAPPAPANDPHPAELVGTYDCTHPQWRDIIVLGADGRYQRGSGDPGRWWFDGTTLHLKWDKWGPAALAIQPDGTFFDPRQNFRMVRAQPAQPAPPPPPPPRELRSQFMRLDRGWYHNNDQPVVYWENLPAGRGGWVSIVPRGTADGEWGDWTYTRGAASGSFSAPHPLPTGEYEVRAYGEMMGPVLDRLPFRVGR